MRLKNFYFDKKSEEYLERFVNFFNGRKSEAEIIRMLLKNASKKPLVLWRCENCLRWHNSKREAVNCHKDLAGFPTKHYFVRIEKELEK